jgi:hypothetical protein
VGGEGRVNCCSFYHGFGHLCRRAGGGLCCLQEVLYLGGAEIAQQLAPCNEGGLAQQLGEI